MAAGVKFILHICVEGNMIEICLSYSCLPSQWVNHIELNFSLSVFVNQRCSVYHNDANLVTFIRFKYFFSASSKDMQSHSILVV